MAKLLRKDILDKWEVENLQMSLTPYADASRTARGEFHTVYMRADSAVRSGIAMKPLYVKSRDVWFDMDKLLGDPCVIDTRRRGATEFRVELAQEDLTTGMRLAQDIVPDIKVTLQGGLVTLTGTYKFVLGNKFKMAGKLDCKNGYHINFVPTAAKVNGVPMPVSGLKMLLSKLNPILDLSEVIMKPKIKALVVEKGKLVAKS